MRKIIQTLQQLVDRKKLIKHNKKRLKITKKTIKEQTEPSDINIVSKHFIPKGWYVHEAGQNPMHMLWFVVIMNFNDVINKVEKPRYFIAEEYDTFEEALQKCVSNIH